MSQSAAMNARSENKPLIGIIAALVYIAIMGVGMIYLTSQGITYGSPEMFDPFWPILIVLTSSTFSSSCAFLAGAMRVSASLMQRS